MIIAAFAHQGLRGVGRVEGDRIRPFARDALGPQALTLGAAAVIAMAAEGRAPTLEEETLALDAVHLRAPIPRPRRNIFCVGKNYADHVAEMAGKTQGDAAAGHPIIFSKPPECVIAPGAPIPIDGSVTEQVDYEGEIAVVIGRGGRGIARENAMAHVWGATLINDVSARDLQKRHGQFLIGKAQDGFCPMGPWVVSTDALDFSALRLRTYVNGERRQDGVGAQMIHDIPAVIAALSAGITLYPGDVIAMGTPAGVGAGFDPPRWLVPGDRVRISVEGLGVLENPVAAWADGAKTG